MFVERPRTKPNLAMNLRDALHLRDEMKEILTRSDGGVAVADEGGGELSGLLAGVVDFDLEDFLLEVLASGWDSCDSSASWSITSTTVPSSRTTS
jgi:hypothetical protein